MKLYLIKDLGRIGYDTYDSAVVAAESEQGARSVSVGDSHSGWTGVPESGFSVEYIGRAKPGTKIGVILASFNAG